MDTLILKKSSMSAVCFYTLPMKVNISMTHFLEFRFDFLLIPTNQELWPNRRHHFDYLVALRWRILILVQSQFYLNWPRNHYGKLVLLPASFILYRCHGDDEIQVLAQLLFN